jgi:hypothetical protein
MREYQQFRTTTTGQELHKNCQLETEYTTNNLTVVYGFIIYVGELVIFNAVGFYNDL